MKTKTPKIIEASTVTWKYKNEETVFRNIFVLDDGRAVIQDKWYSGHSYTHIVTPQELLQEAGNQAHNKKRD